MSADGPWPTPPNVTNHVIGDLIEVSGCRFILRRIEIDGRTGKAELTVEQVFRFIEVRVEAGKP
jgi:hypothetical protein